MGLFEFLYIVNDVSWGLAISVVGWVASALLWDLYDQREKGAAEGTFGVALATNGGYRYMALGCIIGIGAWVAGVTVGDSSKELVGFFDAYDTKQEGSLDGTRDSDGTSIT